jgi:hypothetical protein
MCAEYLCVYHPEDIGILRQALDGSYSALRFAFQHDPEMARGIRIKLAQSIFRIARTGERRSRVMITQVLADFPPMCAQWSN